MLMLASAIKNLPIPGPEKNKIRSVTPTEESEGKLFSLLQPGRFGFDPWVQVRELWLGVQLSPSRPLLGKLGVTVRKEQPWQVVEAARHWMPLAPPSYVLHLDISIPSACQGFPSTCFCSFDPANTLALRAWHCAGWGEGGRWLGKACYRKSREWVAMSGEAHGVLNSSPKFLGFSGFCWPVSPSSFWGSA